MNLLLKGLQWMDGGRLAEVDVKLRHGRVAEIGKNLSGSERVLHFGNHFLYPGLINAHDHLEMNLYPRLGRPPYTNFTQWATDIRQPDESPVKEIEAIPIDDRLLWGGIKNLISGATVVAHHNPWHRLLGRQEFPVLVPKKIAWTHSLAYHTKVRKPWLSGSNLPFVIHAAEGTDNTAAGELQQIASLGWLHRHTVLVHGVGFTDADIATFRDSGASLVWCPASNLYMFGRTARVDALKKHSRVMLGTDSTLTGSASLLDELRVAAGTGMASPRELFDMVTSIPASVFNLGGNAIAVGQRCNFFIAAVQGRDYYENLLMTHSTDIAMHFCKGRLQLHETELMPDYGFAIKIAGSTKRISVDVASLLKRFRAMVPDFDQHPIAKIFT